MSMSVGKAAGKRPGQRGIGGPAPLPGGRADSCVDFTQLGLHEVVRHVRDELSCGRGGRLVVADARWLRHTTLQSIMDSRGGADSVIVIAGTLPTALASRIAGRRRPSVITQARLADALLAACAADERRVYLIGGTPGGMGIPSGAQRAAAILGLRHRRLRVAGCAYAHVAKVVAEVVADVVEAKPDLVILATPAASHDELARELRPALPGSWLLSCPGLIDRIAGPRLPAYGPSGAAMLGPASLGHARLGRRRETVRDVTFAVRMVSQAIARRLGGSVRLGGTERTRQIP